MSRSSQALRWSYHSLRNGLRFVYGQMEGLPLTTGALFVAAGSRHETPEQAGLANLTAELLLQGTQTRNAEAIADRVETAGASLGVQAAEDYTEFGFSVPSDDLPRILNIIVESLVEPSFPSGEIKKEKASIRASLKSRHDSIFNFTYDALNDSLFGPNHPYGRPVEGRMKGVDRFTRDELVTWHRTYHRPRQAVLSIVGPDDPERISQGVERAFVQWADGGASTPGPTFLRNSAAKTIERRLHAKFEQAYYMIGMPGPSVFNPAYQVLKVLNTILGGGMSSRMFLRLREELGLAYEVSAFFPTHIYSSQWVLYLGLPKERLALARRELDRLLADVVAKGIKQNELDQAVAMIKGSYLMEQQSRRRQAWYGAWWAYIGRSPQYSADFVRQLENVSLRQVNELAEQLLSGPRVIVETTA
jgi:zinc protease